MTQHQLAGGTARRTLGWWRTVAIEFRLLARVERVFLLSAAGLVAAALIWATVAARRDTHFQPPMDFGGAFMATLLFTLLWSGEVWRDAPDHARDWFWAQPVDQGAHELARLVAGLGWVAVAAVFLVVAQIVMTLAIGFPLDVSHQNPLMSLDFLTGPLTLFLIASLPGLRSSHPLRWILGVTIGLSVLPEMLGRNARVLKDLRNLLYATIFDPINHDSAYRLGWSAPGAMHWLLSAAIALAMAIAAVVLAARVRRPS